VFVLLVFGILSTDLVALLVTAHRFASLTAVDYVFMWFGAQPVPVLSIFQSVCFVGFGGSIQDAGLQG
jgi:hypothetical protein